MYARNGPNGGGEEAVEGFKQENGCHVVGTPGWSCTSTDHADADADVTTFFAVSSSKLDKHVPCSDQADLGMSWIPRFVTTLGRHGSLDVHGGADRVTCNVMEVPQAIEKNKGGRKTKRGNKGGSNAGKKDVMEIYRISRPSGSKDRHSKVATARGPRDRRMRLSVETAVKFFHVQDRLGFDQPSKAVEWLIDKCTSAIDELPRISHSEYLSDFKSLSSTPMNTTAKRSRNPKERSDQEGGSCKVRRRRGGQGQANEINMETMKLGQGLLHHMRCDDASGIRTLDSLHHKAPYFNYAQYSPEMAFQSYPSSSSVQSADSTTTFSCPFPRVMPSITIDPQSTMPEF